MTNRRGITLPELLVSTGLISLIALALSLTLSSAYPAMDQILVRIQLEQRCRLAMERVVPCLTAAVPATQQAIYEPAAGTTQTWVRFASNQDLLGQPPVRFDPRAIPPGPFFEYRLEQQANTLQLRRLDPGAPGPQVLARDVSVRFTRPADGSASLGVEVSAIAPARSATRQSVARRWTLQTIVGLPAYAR